MSALSLITAVGPVRDDTFDKDIIAADDWVAPGWAEAALDYHKARGKRASIAPYAPEEAVRLRRLMDDSVSHERAWAQLDHNRPTPEATIKAIMFAIRARGVAALNEPAVMERLSRCDADAIEQIDQFLKENV
jgi:hypothetical protein